LKNREIRFDVLPLKLSKEKGIAPIGSITKLFSEGSTYRVQ
jgi:hypothetical protein